MGGDIDASDITKNIMALNAERAYDMDAIDWKEKVQFGGEWDYKDNGSSIFGLAWAYDVIFSSANYENDKYTYFKSDYGKMNSADFGNFNAGYTCTIVGIPTPMQWLGAGMVETKKNEGWLGLIKGICTNKLYTPPYGDRPRDFMYNTLGMTLGKVWLEKRNEEIKRMEKKDKKTQ